MESLDKYQAIFLDYCCAAWSLELYQAALKAFELLFGYVMPYEKLIKKITQKLKLSKVPIIQ